MFKPHIKDVCYFFFFFSNLVQNQRRKGRNLRKDSRHLRLFLMIVVLITSRLSGNNIFRDEVRCCVRQAACRTGHMNLLLLIVFF